MADPSDLLHAWQEVIRRLQGAAAPLTEQELVKQLIAPLQKQAELLEQVTVPLTATLGMLDQTASAMRAQADAFNAAAASFKTAAELVDAQAALLETATQSMRDPLGAIKSAGGAVAGRGKSD
jgi:ABC-type transporter Mla subunit MlaD